MPIYKGIRIENKTSYFAYFLLFVEWLENRSEFCIFAF